MSEEHTTAVVQRYLDELGGDSPVEPIVRALLLAPDWARAHHSLGVALLAMGRWDEMDDCYPLGVKSLAGLRGQAQG